MTLEDQYEQWMFERFTGFYSKDYIIDMCGDSEYWEIFLEELEEK